MMLHGNRFCRSIRPGTWRPATLVRGDVITLKLLLAVFALVRAADYFTSAYHPGEVAGIEETVPAQVWGGMSATIGVALLVGIWAKSHGLVWFGHFTGAVMYVALAVGAAQFAFSVNPPDEWRRVGPLAVMAYVHWMFALRSGPEPLPHGSENEQTVERAVGPRT